VLRDMEELSDSDVAEITGLRQGTIRVRLHRARLFVRKELARNNGIPARRAPATPGRGVISSIQPRRGRCKDIFAELSNYLDDELDDSLCEELEKHMQGCQPCVAFLADLEKSVEQCRHAPGELPDPRVAAKLRRDVMSRYQDLMATAIKSCRIA
jgi:RNA polymerase sigma-70 factor, ECF subfamily